jgi:hypothetical protein
MEEVTDGADHMKDVRFQVLTVASMKMAVFWVVAPCNLVEVCRRFRERRALMMEASNTTETSVNLYQTTRRNKPEDSRRHMEHNFVVT